MLLLLRLLLSVGTPSKCSSKQPALAPGDFRKNKTLAPDKAKMAPPPPNPGETRAKERKKKKKKGNRWIMRIRWLARLNYPAVHPRVPLVIRNQHEHLLTFLISIPAPPPMSHWAVACETLKQCYLPTSESQPPPSTAIDCFPRGRNLQTPQAIRPDPQVQTSLCTFQTVQ